MGYDNERVSGFIKSFYSDDEGMLGDIYSEARLSGVPVIRPDTREYIKTQLLIKKPMRILEIGTAVGYSSLYMSLYMPEGATITTVELDGERYEKACANVQAMKKEHAIELLLGDASEVIKGFDENTFDMVFVDAAKGQYINYLPEILRIIKHEGIIISDNVMQEGDILESHFTVEKRNRTIHDRMREYLYKLTHDEMLTTAIIPVGDGLAVTHVAKNS